MGNDASNFAHGVLVFVNVYVCMYAAPMFIVLRNSVIVDSHVNSSGDPATCMLPYGEPGISLRMTMLDI